MEQREVLIERLLSRLHDAGTGGRDFITVRPGGKQDGLDYGPLGVEIVVLDPGGEGEIAYRPTCDQWDGEWELGDIESAVDYALDLDELTPSDA